ncbi:hypothetical protein OMA_04970 [Enterococcus faecium EnGen0045]|nr:hypothetical protein OMC_05342 [Enterococcus faecium EnGen0049]ELB82004.1 hypothetical protein OMA_04970 [Enterococcus faecium EnGen0045]
MLDFHSIKLLLGIKDKNIQIKTVQTKNKNIRSTIVSSIMRKAFTSRCSYIALSVLLIKYCFAFKKTITSIF